MSMTVEGLTFRWDEEKQGLLVTTPRDQKLLTGSSAAQLLDFLLSIQREIYAAEQARDLPSWIQQPERQIVAGGIIVEAQAQPEPEPRQITAAPRLFLPSKTQAQE